MISILVELIVIKNNSNFVNVALVFELVSNGFLNLLNKIDGLI